MSLLTEEPPETKHSFREISKISEPIEVNRTKIVNKGGRVEVTSLLYRLYL